MLVLVAGGQMRPVLAAAEVVGHMGVLVIVDLGIVTVLFTHDQAFLPPGDRRFVVQRSVELLSSPLSLVSLSLSLPESVESLSSPLSLPESEESASSPVSPSLTVAPPCTWTPGQIVLISSSSSWMVSTPMARPPPRSLLIGCGSVVAVDLAGRVDPMVRAGGRERADCRAHEPATACL